MHACMHTYIQTDRHTYRHTHIHTYTYIYIYMYPLLLLLLLFLLLLLSSMGACWEFLRDLITYKKRNTLICTRTHACSTCIPSGNNIKKHWDTILEETPWNALWMHYECNMCHTVYTVLHLPCRCWMCSWQPYLLRNGLGCANSCTAPAGGLCSLTWCPTAQQSLQRAVAEDARCGEWQLLEEPGWNSKCS